MTQAVRNNIAESRYELTIDGQTAFAAYALRDNLVTFTHTIVPKPLEGKGVASGLINGALADVRTSGRKILPLCSFVARYIERHPQEADLISQ